MSTAEREIKKVQPIILEFPREDYEDDKGGKRDTLSRKEFFKYLAHESRAKYQQYKPTPCLLKFLAEEREYESLSRSSSQKLNEEVKRAHIVQRRNHGNLRRQSQAPRLGITLRLKRKCASRFTIEEKGAIEALFSIKHASHRHSTFLADQL
ncbi:uncharacterized protein [Physcomitrium patens]|uniref:uncharacterized protein n=1 Tax=Physcomitrium patens TaxID=3218 RepID=UPI003CCD21D6